MMADERAVLARIVDAYGAVAGPTDIWVEGGGHAGPWIYAPVADGWTVVASIDAERWRADRQHGDGRSFGLEDGPMATADDAEVVSWLRRVCDAEADREPRTYVIGLPVVIVVHGDGRVQVEVDLSEASDLADDSGTQPDDLTADELATDVRRVEQAVREGTTEVSAL